MAVGTAMHVLEGVNHNPIVRPTYANVRNQNPIDFSAGSNLGKI